MAFTPPVSPFEYSSVGEDSCPFFQSSYGLDCDGGVQEGSFNNEGLVRCRESSLIGKPELLKSRNSNFNLFGMHYDADSASSCDLERLFCLARKRLCNLSAAVRVFGVPRAHITPASTSDMDYSEYRKDLKDFYLMIRYFLAIQDEDSEWIVEEMNETIRRGLFLMRLELGWLSDLPKYVLEYANVSKASSAYQLFHAHLELRWFHISVLYQQHIQSHASRIDFSQSTLKEPNLFSSQSSEALKEAILNAVVDLTWMAVIRFDRTDRGELVSKSMFNCPCVKELWLLLLTLIGQIHAGNDKKHPFWSLMDDVFERLTTEEDGSSKVRRIDLRIPDKIRCENPSMFSLWFLSNLAELFLYDGEGNRQKSKLEGNECNYLALKSALTNLTEGFYSLSEEDRRVVVHLVCDLMEHYDQPKPDPIMILWECFFRSLDLPFQLPGARAGNFAVLSDTPRGLINSVKKLLEQQPKIKSNTSFEAFLHLLGSHLKNNPLNWKQKMRGRVFSKLSPKKVLSLSERGLFHLVQFFFAVSLKTDLQDMAAKLNELLSAVDQTCDSKRRTLSALARIALVEVMAENGLPFENVVKQLVSDVSLAVGRGDLEIPRLFVDSIEDILKCNDSLELGQHLIVGDWINQYLQRLSHDSFNPVLHALVTLVKQLRANISYGSMAQGPTELYKSLQLSILPVIKHEMASADLAPFLVADLAAHFTLLSLEVRLTSKDESFNQLLKKFVESDSSNVMLVRRYLWLIFNEKSVVSNALNRCSEHELLAITQAWMRICLFSANTNHEEIQALTYEIFRLPIMSRLFKIYWGELEQIATDSDPFISLLETIEKTVNAGTNSAEVRRGFQTLMQPIERWLKSLKLFYSPPKGKDGSRPPFPQPPKEIMGQPSKEALARLYFCFGTIFMKCPRTVFERSSANCLLVKLVPIILLPSALYDFDSQLSVTLDEAMRSTLDRFLIGLYRLDPVRDPCIKRYFRDIVSIFVPRMVSMGGTMGGVAQNNPLKQLWVSGEPDAEEVGSLVLLHVAEIFLNPAKRLSPQYLLVLKYVQILLRDFTRHERLYISVITHILPSAFEISVKSSFDNKTVQETNSIIQLILKSSLFANTPSLRSALDGALKQLNSRHLSFSPDLVFRILSNLGKEYPRIVLEFLPTLKESIDNVTKMRGVGTDRKLEALYDGLSKALR